MVRDLSRVIVAKKRADLRKYTDRLGIKPVVIMSPYGRIIGLAYLEAIGGGRTAVHFCRWRPRRGVLRGWVLEEYNPFTGGAEPLVVENKYILNWNTLSDPRVKECAIILSVDERGRILDVPIAPTPVHEELARLSAENKRLYTYISQINDRIRDLVMERDALRVERDQLRIQLASMRRTLHDFMTKIYDYENTILSQTMRLDALSKLATDLQNTIYSLSQRFTEVSTTLTELLRGADRSLQQMVEERLSQMRESMATITTLVSNVQATLTALRAPEETMKELMRRMEEMAEVSRKLEERMERLERRPTPAPAPPPAPTEKEQVEEEVRKAEEGLRRRLGRRLE